jgi:exopolysaccharide production protein ExoZ
MMRPLASIQILRALAAISVTVTHVQVDLVAQLGLPHALPDLEVGTAGVDVFFIISGFIMVYSSELLYGQPSGPSMFFARRILRIVPLYWICTTLYILIPKLVPELERSIYSPSLIIASYLFFPYPRPEGMFPVAGQGWTLNYEMLFYVIFSLAIFCPRRVAVALAAIVLATAVGVGQFLGPLPQPFEFWADPLVLEFGLGMAVGLAYVEGVRLPVWPRLMLILAGLALIYLFATPPAPTAWHRALGWGVPAAMIVVGASFGRLNWETRAAALLVMIGDASYALYLFHPFSIRAFRELALRSWVDPASQPWLYLVLALMTATAMALAIHYAVEKPITRTLRKAFLPRAAQARGMPA